ncbi:hypothetical protein RND81_10G206300 [Saponaria officinalis]|uniref:Peptidase A1 domain-containing protein n=1 Tax=Saponaria officinalis TaxID=3572 RepID=A0AAW1I5X7_SAPOF
MDTGSELIWVQCEDCQKRNKCFGNPPDFFKNTKSNSYNPIPSDTQRLCYLGKCINDFCSYITHYADEFTAEGILAFETFTFGNGPRQNDITGESMIYNLIFGCNRYFSGPDHMKHTIGLLGLGWGDWGPKSLMSQIKTQIEDIFSYCFPHYDESAIDVQGYLKLGLEGNLEDGFSSTALLQFEDSDYYYLNLEVISVNNKKFPILSSVFIRKNNDEGGTIIDSGNAFTDLTPRAYKVLNKTMLA